ncbi:hypothetical protein C7S20_05645 [Christiangramia fulva]|uniref:DNA-directed RNA polymerase n=1 Tax=Christiangramia fulva TaxID=2126553 RepID=A0A2R3Z3F5_9FLAO|nr:hypothetical protein [Christiangramia fulva]AVR44791.1 hypothetical protein C7S20_05645 [Christiangramia fulva]
MKYRAENQTTYYFFLPQEIFEGLKRFGWANGTHTFQKKKLKFDVICFFIHLISYRSSISRKISKYGYVRLQAKLLKKYHHEYKIYLEFLEKHRFIKTQPYSIKKHRAKGYKLNHPKKSQKIIRYIPEDFVIRKKLSHDKLEKRSKADKTTGHLTQWLTSEHLSVHYNEGLNYLQDVKMKDSKRYSRRYLLEMLNNGVIYYQREGKDNRLHSILSNCPRDLRRFIAYKGNETLISCDMKSSQPFLLAGLLNLLFLSKEDSSSKERVQECISSIVDREVRDGIVSSISTMIPETMEEVDIRGIELFVYLVTKGDLYDHIASHFSDEFLHSIQTPLGISDQFFNEKKQYKEWVEFDSLRDYVKKAIMEFLYSSTQNKEKRCKEVRRFLPPAVSNIVDDFKIDNKTYFPIFLQNLEAYLILDRITKKISHQYPEIPLFTIHDSIVTTELFAMTVKEAMEDDLQEFFGIRPLISVEEWSLHAREPPP